MENNAQAAPRNASQRIAIIGAGAAGMLTAIRLREAGFDNIVIYEKADEVGGTWRENRYPGVACDVPAHHYNFSFAPNPGWHHRLAQGDEIQGYMKSVAEKYRLRPHIVFGQRAAADASTAPAGTSKPTADCATGSISSSPPPDPCMCRSIRPSTTANASPARASTRPAGRKASTCGASASASSATGRPACRSSHPSPPGAWI